MKTRALEQLVRDRLSEDAAHFAVVIENLTDGRPVVAFLPDGTLVEHKTANWDTATHDAGIVHRKKETYVIVLMSDLDSGAARVEADVAQIAFDYFER